MLKNYFKIAWRNLIKGKLYSAINITGLAVGIACCMLIGLYVYEELRFDRFHEKADQIYRLNVTSVANNSATAWTPHPLAAFLREGYADIEQVTSIFNVPGGVVRVGNQLFEQPYHATDPGFFEVFDFAMIRGNASAILESPNDIILTESAAQRFFGTADVIGNPIELRLDGNYYQAAVGGVVKDPPQYSSIQFQVLIPFNLWVKADPSTLNSTNWNTFRGNRFALVQPQANIENLENTINSNMSDQVDEAWESNRFIWFQSLKEIHFEENVSRGLEPTANASFIYIAVIIGGLILLIACINFTSLSIGHSVRRAREVGMRKAMGAQRSQLITQFWGETMLVTLVALAGGLLLAEILLPYFGSLVNLELELNLFQNPVLVGIVLGIVLLAGLLAGSYPALYLSKFRPSQVFQSKIHLAGNHGLVRVLTGVQFTLAVTLIIGTFFMNEQMGFLVNTNPGYEEEYVIQMTVPVEEGIAIMEELQTRLGNDPPVTKVSGGWHGLSGMGASFFRTEITAGGQETEAYAFGVEPGMPELLELRLVEGRYFSETREVASNEVLINETMAGMLDWDNPIGRTMSRVYGGQDAGDATVVGIVEDFHFQSMHREIGPLVIQAGPFVQSIYARIDGHNIQQALNSMEEAWQEAAPGIPFDYTFLDEQIEQQYRSDQRWANIVELASVIAILISCMGLFGLATLASVKRAKEIGIRKVLGATGASITATLSKDFLKPVVAGLLLAIPLSYLLMQSWLADFAYRIELEVGTFILAAVITLTIALLTVSYQSIKTALMNPVESLKSE